MIYKFEWLNNGFEIVDPVVEWTSAGFNTIGNGKLTVDILLTTPQAKFSVTLSAEGQANNRSDEAITGLMNELLKPYIIK